MNRYIVFTDLDGTLLDYASYGFEEARPALRRLSEMDAPIVLASSKTRAEIDFTRKVLENDDPFICENGGAVYIPAGTFAQIPYGLPRGEYMVVEWGRPYRYLRETLIRIRKELGIDVSGYGDMTTDEIILETGLDRDSAVRAQQREYDEPFTVPAGETRVGALIAAVEESGLNVTRGGRYYHLSGEQDKGRAARFLADLYRSKFGPVRTIGLGDNLNDVTLLENVDIPVLIRRYDGTYADVPPIGGLIRTRAIGPAGWNEALLELFDQDP